MNSFEDYFYLGHIINPHGFLGKVNAYLDTDAPQEYKELDAVFININGSLVPYFILSIKILNQKAIISFQDVGTIEQSEFLTKKEMYLPLSQLPKLTGNQFYFHEIDGFEIIDANYGSLGLLKEVIEYPSQAVLQVFYKKKEVLIPINSNIIKKLDRDKKCIYIDAPDGLIDMYLDV